MSGLREVSRCIRQLPKSPLTRPAAPQTILRRCASSQAAAAQVGTAAPAVRAELDDLEQRSSQSEAKFGEDYKQRAPWVGLKDRNALPGGRYHYFPPKYDRGPLHPLQVPRQSDPTARDFVPGPFNNPRLRQTYESTIMSDYLTLAYNHIPPGEYTKPVDKSQFRKWEGDNPYFENRPLRPPRGSARYRIAEHDISFANVPEITQITLACHVPESNANPLYLFTARTMLQTITGVVPEVTKYKNANAGFGLQKGKASGAKVTLKGNQAYEWLDKCIHIVMPQIKEWPGVKGSTGDNKGNIAWGFEPKDMVLFPEIESNISTFPPKMLPGCRVFITTSARSTRHARLLLQSLGIPFYGALA
ncbi:hypothetical protein MCOR27_007163 [Pyricularia oryzae]|uniref:Ribosomal protein L5 n=1 Tax=Pyricularia grisea TaxID=148305 RepID=A0ABQ8NXI7_PYRGI|nr:hypothetical protein MCOR01_003222 [Pyricularia oryzae]KAI6303540.1 hypothetical protein MCOR33_001419 [Pyricularia grisea]KAI6257452.1 hypothetical protein MCOR19_006137 [Pyricularia oryzae]KAI6275071.1 hypothetical protein MCOR27_007163 [Pyricularia oryzae]KAI6279783.1 hypothetical protein MCOR26_004072 [Pyricularia oryzae]